MVSAANPQDAEGALDGQAKDHTIQHGKAEDSAKHPALGGRSTPVARRRARIRGAPSSDLHRTDALAPGQHVAQFLVRRNLLVQLLLRELSVGTVRRSAPDGRFSLPRER